MLRTLIQDNEPDCSGKITKVWYDLSEFESADEMLEKGCFEPFEPEGWHIAELESDIPCLPGACCASLPMLIDIERRWANLGRLDKAAACAYTEFIEEDACAAIDMAERGEYIVWTNCRNRADVARESYKEGFILECLDPEYEDIVDWEAIADRCCGTLCRLDGTAFIEFDES